MQTVQNLPVAGCVTHSTPIVLPKIQRDISQDFAYRALGIALASSVSAVFWIAILAVILPAWNVTPTANGLVLTGIGIAFVVSAALLALASTAY
jgi:hypothetical protein